MNTLSESVEAMDPREEIMIRDEDIITTHLGVPSREERDRLDQYIDKKLTISKIHNGYLLDYGHSNESRMYTENSRVKHCKDLNELKEEIVKRVDVMYRNDRLNDGESL